MINLNEEELRKILLAENYVQEKDLERASVYAATHHIPFVDALFVYKAITKTLLGQALAEHFKLPYADINSKPPSREIVNAIPEALAKNHRIVIFDVQENSIVIATDTPQNTNLKTTLKNMFPSKEVILAYTLPEDLDQAFVYYRKPLKTRFSDIIASQRRIAPEIIDEILEDAFLYHASDIHLEPQEKDVIIRFRVDGVLHEAGRVSKEHYEGILNRIKVQAHLRIDEHFAPQDGAIRHTAKENPVDLRVSIIPTLDGEKVAIRLLSQYVRDFALQELGLSPYGEDILSRAAKKPFGMILISGPTGSGKTTTLYAILKLLNRTEVNITTIEDPVEYKIEGVNQIQVNSQTHLTFTEGLRSIVRQDPNIILVGEIRDSQTAEIAVNAALTGHLLLSTFHANDAATAIVRLHDMNIEPFLAASTLELVVSQRLMRKICTHCRVSYVVRDQDIRRLAPYAVHYFGRGVTLYRGKGCDACGDTGYKGRTAIFEFIEMTRDMKDLILTKPSMNQVWDVAVSQGAKSLFEDGVLKVLQGISTLEELLRVASPSPRHVSRVASRKRGKLS